jgi:hypothetical protein
VELPPIFASYLIDRVGRIESAHYFHYFVGQDEWGDSGYMPMWPEERGSCNGRKLEACVPLSLSL